MRVDRFHNSWVVSRASVQDWLEQHMHYYSRHSIDHTKLSMARHRSKGSRTRQYRSLLFMTLITYLCV